MSNNKQKKTISKKITEILFICAFFFAMLGAKIYFYNKPYTWVSVGGDVITGEEAQLLRKSMIKISPEGEEFYGKDVREYEINLKNWKIKYSLFFAGSIIFALSGIFVWKIEQKHIG